MPADSPADRAAALLRSAVSQRLFPCGVAEVGSSGGVIWSHTSGNLTFDEDAPPASANTIFDLASLTKPLATTAVTLRLAAEGRLPLHRRIRDLSREWLGADREPVTVQDLLEHTGGLSPRLLDPPPEDERAFEHEIGVMPLEYEPRTRAVYTDLGFILLAIVCARAGAQRFTQLVEGVLRVVDVHEPGVNGAHGLFPEVPAAALHRTAPTSPMLEDRRRGRRLIGEVHDNYAAALGGLAGHAGLFGTASGVGSYARLLLRAGLGDRSLPQPFTPDMMALATTRSSVPGSSRALGWDTMKPTSSCGTKLSEAAFGHVGFTGTSLWIDPGRDRYYVLLSNRVCEGGTSDDMQSLRRAFHDIVSEL